MQVTEWVDAVINCTPIHVKLKSKLTNLMKIFPIEGYNGKYRLNPQESRAISDDLFTFDQIERRIDERNWLKWYFMKENFKTIPWNQKSSNFTSILRRNWRSKWGVISRTKNHNIDKIKNEINLINDFKMKLNGKRQ